MRYLYTSIERNAGQLRSLGWSNLIVDAPLEYLSVNGTSYLKHGKLENEFVD